MKRPDGKMLVAIAYCLTVAIGGAYIADLRQDNADKDATIRLLTSQLSDDVDAMKSMDNTALAAAMALTDRTGRLRKEREDKSL